jgi:hypothetical protein
MVLYPPGTSQTLINVLEPGIIAVFAENLTKKEMAGIDHFLISFKVRTIYSSAGYTIIF